MDLSAVIQLLLNTGREQVTRTFPGINEPSHIYYLRNQDGTIVKIEAEPSPPTHQAFSLQTIVEKAKEHEGTGAEIWYSRRGVVCLFDSSRRGRITLPITFSRQYSALCDLEVRQTKMTQIDILRLLRVTMRECLEDDSIIGTLKLVKFAATDDSQNEVSTGKVSIGKKLTREVTGTTEFPETIKLNIPLFESPGCFSDLSASVECALEPDAVTATFQLIPLPGQLESALVEAEDAIGGTIMRSEGLTVPVLYGNPGP